MKKIAAVLGAMLMAVFFCLPARAADITAVTIMDPTEGHTYEVYQLLTGDVDQSADKTVLSNIAWGSSLESSALAAGTNAQDFATTLSAMTDTQLQAEADSIYSELGKPVATLSSNSASATLTPGYYLISELDSTGTLISKGRFIMGVFGDETVYPKTGTPTIDKEVMTSGDTTWQTSATAAEDETVQFRISAALPGNVDGYTSGYELTFTDTLSKGLTYEGDAVYEVVGQDGKEISTGSITGTVSGQTVTFSIANVMASPYDAGNYDTIFIVYNAKLNANAQTGYTGNLNSVSATYSNDMNDSSSTGTSVEKSVTVYTYEVSVAKTNEKGNALAGAQFELAVYKDGAWTPVSGTANAAGTVFDYTGLNVGRYRLTETTTPDGYNTIDPLYFNITASANGEVVVEDADADGTAQTGTNTWTVSDDGLISTSVVNKAGLTLPETGGTGPAAIFAGGLVLAALGAGIWMTKRKQ
jgi:fimbrial isopeptide formation D2 family protein/LPXTG-motif cell wall-anchored protein